MHFILENKGYMCSFGFCSFLRCREQQLYDYIMDLYFSFSLLSWILLHSDSRLLHFVCRRRYPRYFEFHSTQNPLCAVKEKEKIPKEKEISAVVQNLQEFQCTNFWAQDHKNLLLKFSNSKSSSSSFAATMPLQGIQAEGLNGSTSHDEPEGF